MGRKRTKRGYPVAIVIGFCERHNTFVRLWQIFSVKTKPFHPATISLGRKVKYADAKQLYQFFEQIIDNIRPVLKQGVQTVILVSDLSRDLPEEFFQHIKKHYLWMTQNPRHPIEFGQLTGTACHISEVTDLRETEPFIELLEKVRNKESASILRLFEQRLHQETEDHPDFLVGLPEIEAFVYGRQSPQQIQPEYILCTDSYLARTRNKNRINRLLQIAQNRHIKTRIIAEESPAGMRVEQFGGLICFTESPRSYQIRTNDM